MWLVVYSQSYYPSVYECETEEEAKEIFNQIKEKEFRDSRDETYENHHSKLYITKIKDTHGTACGEVDWYLSIR